MANKKSIPFIKMQGTGNDFVVLDNRDEQFSMQELIEITPHLCHRKYGIGADGLLALQKAGDPTTDYAMIYRNADGSDAGMCGNGSRCLALLARELGLGNQLTFRVHDKTYHAEVKSSTEITISFPVKTQVHPIELEDEQLWQVFPGTEHVAKEVSLEQLDREEELIEEGNKLRHHQRFQPEGTNANFFCGTGIQSLKLQTYERGVEDLTLACGTGAITSAICWHHAQKKVPNNNNFEVTTKGGTLKVTFDFDPVQKTYYNIKLIGPAEFVFKGEYYA